MTEKKLQKVLDFLRSNRSITKDDMRNKCYYSNGGDAIFKLRNRGHIINGIWEKTSTGARYMRYMYQGVKKVAA